MGTLWPLGSAYCPVENRFPHSLTLLLCSFTPPSPSLPTTAPAPSPQFIGHAGGYYSLIKRTCYPWQTHKRLAVLSLNEALTSSVNPRFPKWGPGTSRGPSVRALGIGTTDFKFHSLHCSCHRTRCLQV